MKNKYLFPLALLLVGCSSFGKDYDLAYKALDELQGKVSYYSTIEIKNALYHPYSEESELNELVVIYFTYDSDVLDLDNYLMYSYDKVNYNLILGDEAEKYFYFATGMDNDNYVSLDPIILNGYIGEANEKD